MPLDENAFLQWLGANGPGLFVIAVVIAVVMVTMLVVAKIWEPLKQTVLTMDAILKLPETLKENADHFASIDAKLDTQTGELAEVKTIAREARQIAADVKHEVLPNSGNSLRDQVDKQGKLVRSVQGTVRAQGKRLGAIEKSLEMTQQPEAVKRARARAHA